MRFYRALLHLYPASFRAEYGDEMCAVFDRSRTSMLAATFEVLPNALAVHWDILRQDLRYATRTLARAPGFTTIAILVLALGIGANTAVFSVTDYALIRPLPFPSADRLVQVWEKLPGYREMELSPANYRDWRRMNTVFEEMGAITTTAVNFIGQGAPERIQVAYVTASLFPVLGVQPLLGRPIIPADDRDGAPRTAVLSYGLWQRAFGGDAAVLGRKVNLDGTPYVVIGIMPAEFHYPDQDVELWMPFAFPEAAFADRNDNDLEGVARLRRGVSLQQARAEMDVVADQLRRQYPKELEHTGAVVDGMRDEISEQRRLLLMALAGAALCVLLIACSNLANLLLARALARQRELGGEDRAGGRPRAAHPPTCDREHAPFVRGRAPWHRASGCGAATANQAGSFVARIGHAFHRPSRSGIRRNPYGSDGHWIRNRARAASWPGRPHRTARGIALGRRAKGRAAVCPHPCGSHALGGSIDLRWATAARIVENTVS
jgi:MacB-like periplasmic core domain